MAKKHSDETRALSIELLLEGKTIDEVSEETGVNRNTIISWRQSEKKQRGVEFPTHYSGRKNINKFVSSFRYSDEEIISLARQNPGFGVQRFCKQLYPRTKKLSEVRFRITMLLQEYFSEAGEDLYELLQNPDFSTLVTENEYQEITGKNIPSGHGRRGSSSGQKSNRDIRQKMTMIPLPPQEFNWGEIATSEDRPRHNVEERGSN